MFHKHPGGKGDKPILPKDQEQFDNNWDNIFKKKPVANKGIDGKCNGFCGEYECKQTPRDQCKR